MSKKNPLVESIRLINAEAQKNGGTVLAGGFYGDDAIVIIGSNGDVYVVSVEEGAVAKVVANGEETFRLVRGEGVAVTYEYRVAVNKIGDLGFFKPNTDEPLVLLTGDVVEHFKEASRRAMLLRSEALAQATLPP